MAGYKLGQKVLLSNGAVKNIEDVQLGDSVYSFDIPEIITGIDFREIESLTLNVDNIQSPEVTNIYNDEGNYLQINGLGVIDENVLAYHKNDKRYQFVSTIDLVINGERKQVGNTNYMIYNFVEIIAFVSKYMTLEPGDIIFTGTPALGAGLNYKGDHLQASIEGELLLDFKLV